MSEACLWDLFELKIPYAWHERKIVRVPHTDYIIDNTVDSHFCYLRKLC
jgi:hypothetical protein